MGEHNVEQELDDHKVQVFMRALLDDLRALDYMLDHDLIESGVRRIGAEQEMFLIDKDLRPAPVAFEVLQLTASGCLGFSNQLHGWVLLNQVI